MLVIVLPSTGNAQCRLLNETFATAPVLSATNVDGAWYPDRYQPAGFVADAGRLKISISAADGAQLRPGGFSGAFYNTQGRKFNQCGKCVTVVKGDIYIPADWATKHRRTDMWATVFDNADAVSGFPILGFANIDGASPTLRYWDDGTGWVNVAGLVYNTWITFEISITGGNVVYKVNGATVGTVASPASVYVGNVIMQAYNFNDNTLGSAYDPSADNSYDAFWDNIITTGTGGKVVTNINTGLTFCSIQSAVNAATAGDVISASAGTFDEQVVVNKGLTIRGNNTGIAGNGVRNAESILTGNAATHSGFVITANNVTIDGFKITSCGGTYNSGVYNAPGTTGTQIFNNIITDNIIGGYPTGNTVFRKNLFDANNRPGASGGAGIYLENSNGLTIDSNEFKGHLINSAVIFAATAANAHQNVTFTKNYIHNNNASNSMVYCVAINGGVFRENEITQPGTTAIKFAGANSNILVSYNNLNSNGTGVKIADDGFGLGNNTAIQVHFNQFASNTIAAIQNDQASLTVDATCNWYGNISGPTIVTNVGGTGSVIAGTGGKRYANWLNYGTDASSAIGIQLPANISTVPGSNISAAINHYRVLSNAIGCLVDNQKLTLAGTFNFSNFTAQSEWAKGNNGFSGDGVGPVNGTGDDYTITAPDSVNNVTITAASLGAATIQGPGDIPTVALENPLFFNDKAAGSSNKGWTISNLVIKDFDVSIIADLNGGNTTAFNNFKITNNRFYVPVDLNATTGGETTNFQNIGIHYAFGSNQEISNNTFYVDGSGASDDGAGKYSTSIVMQSATSGGNVYDGLKIKNNNIIVDLDPDPIAPAVIRGIWENGHNTNSAIEISGNTFTNSSAGNTANLNRQNAFWVTSRSSASKKVVYTNNEVSDFKEGVAWLGGLYTSNTPPNYEAGAFPVEVTYNKFDKMLNAIVVRKSTDVGNSPASPAFTEKNSFTNFVPGGLAIKNEGTGNAQSVCNWYGTVSIPGITALNSGPVYLASFLNSGVDGSVATGFQPTGTCLVPPVHNVTQDIYYTSIQPSVSAANNGDSITVSSGTYNEQVLVNKSVNLTGIGLTQPIVDYTGVVSGKPTLFDVSVDGVTIDNFNFNVDLSKLKSAVIASGAGIDNIVIKNNLIGAYGTPSAGTYGDRNAVSINYGGSTNYRVATGGVNSVTFTNNTVTGSGPGSYFRAGIAADEVGGTITGNTLQSINHDALVRFGSNGAVTLTGNTFNGGGVEVADQNAAAGPITVSNNLFNGAFAIASAPGTAILRVKNNYNNIAHVISGNKFNAYDWAVSLENMGNITMNADTFNTAVANAHAVVVNTKSITGNSSTIVQVPVSLMLTNSNFNGTGTALSFLNHDNDAASYGTFTIGTAGNENNFANTLSSFITFDGQTGTSSGSVFPAYTSLIGAGAGALTTMACWSQGMNAQNNKFDVGSGLQLPSTMNYAERTALEAALTHKPDNSCLGVITYFAPVHNLNQNTYYTTIQAGINAANVNDVIECAEWIFNERVTIDKSLTLQGIDSATTIITGSGLSGTGNGITINNGVTNVTIKKLTVKNFAGASGNANAGIYAIGGNNSLLVDLVGIVNNVGGSGFYANGPVNGVTVTHVTSTGHTIGARGIVIWNGLKENINISNNHVYGNNCCGIELQDGTGTNVTVNNNNVHDNGDNGIGITGLMGPGANTVSSNTLLNNGRFGIEIKNPSGTGANSGAGSVVIDGNNVSRTNPIGAEVRDIAGIAVFRRGVLAGNVDVPYGAVVSNNSVSGYTQPSNSDGFGIVLEGINHTATGNTLNGNDVGIQRQAGHTPYPGDGDQSNLADSYFGRGNSPVSCGITITGSVYGNILANGINTRDVGNSYGTGIVVNTTTGKSYCTIQAAINDPLTLNGHTITASSGSYNEDVVVNKQLTILGAGYATTTVSGPIGGGGATFSVQAAGVIIDGFTVTRDGNNVTDWNGALNTAGISIQGQTNNAEIRNSKIFGNRTGIDINNSNGNSIHNNIIDNNRTGLIFRNQTDNTNVQENFITNNWTVGVLFLDGSGGTNSPVQTAANSTFNNNDISGNWYGEIVDRQNGGSLPAPGANIKNFDCNWYGAISAPVTSNANSSEPGYAAQIPVIFGGAATAPGGQPDILGTASANIDFVSWLTNGTDNAPGTIGFQPVPGSCTGTPVIITSVVPDQIICGETTGSLLVTFNGGTGPYDIAWSGTATGSATGITSPYTIPALLAGPYTVTVTDANGSFAVNNTSVQYLPVYNTSTGLYYSSIQAAINAPATVTGNVINVCAGTYAENVIVSKSVTLNGPNAATNGCAPRVAEAIVRPAVSAISSGEIFHVAASNVTIAGFTIDGDNPSLTSGYLGTNGADIDAAEGVTNYEDNVNNLTVTNNIIRNLSYFGVTIYGGYDPTPPYADHGIPSSGHTVSNNKIEYLGTYDAGSGIDRWGGGVLLYNNQYAAISNNCMDNVRLGVQTGNYSQANPGAPGFQVISGNTMTNVRRTGVFHNLHYSNASVFSISGNTISGLSNVNETKWDGIALSSLSVPSTTSGNTIIATGITQPSTGIEVWNVKSISPATITGGSITDATNGIFVNNYDGYSSDAGDGAHASVSNITITPSASGNGIRLLDNALSSHANVQASIGAGVIITNGANGLVVENTSASVTALGNVAFSGQSGDYIKLISNANNINATTATFNGNTGAGSTFAQNFAIEDKITHKIDSKPLGFVTVKVANAFVTDIAPLTPTATNNDYTRIRNAVEAVSNNWTINHNGNFDWTEANAAAAWALGNDGVVSAADDYSVLVPANLNGVTFTAPLGLGTATIQGPGDLAAVNLEGVLVFDGGDNQNWTISNMEFLDFDLSIGMFNGAGGTDAFNNTTITNNTFRIANDLNATVAPADVNQNIGIHYSFGSNQTISNNTFNVPGNGVSAGANLSSMVVMQSNTSGGAVYDGLQILNNIINVLDVQSANPSRILGIWENGHNMDAAITISGNIFNNVPGNDPSLNLQRAFRITSKGGATKNVLYQNNEVTGANQAFEWISGYTYPGGATPVQILNNKVDNAYDGVVVRTTGNSAMINSNSFTNTVRYAINNEPATGIVNGTCNWYGSLVPATVAALMNGPVVYSPWLSNGTDIAPGTTGFQPVPGSCTQTCTLLLTQNVGSPVNASCFGANNGSINVTVGSGSGNNTYAWTGNNPGPYTNNIEDLSSLFAGTYNLLVTDNYSGCAATLPTVTITQPNPLVGNITGTDVVAQSLVNTSPITFSATGGTKPYTFSYKINGVVQAPLTTVGLNSSVTVYQSNLILGAYVYELTNVADANGCSVTLPVDPTATITVQVSIPRPDLYSQVNIVPNNSQFSSGQSKEGYVTISNASVSPTTGTITFRVSYLAGFNLQILGNTTMSGATPVDNNNWTISADAFYYTITSKPGTIINGTPGLNRIGYQLTATGAAGNSGVMTVTILNGTGGSTLVNGDSNNGNNSSVKLFSIN